MTDSNFFFNYLIEMYIYIYIYIYLYARFTNEIQARLGMVEASLAHGPIWFNVNPDLTLSLNDGAPEKALTLRINTSGYQMIEGSRPLALVYRIYYKLFKSNLNPQALIKDPQKPNFTTSSK